MSTEADTCRKYVVPKLLAAGWDDDPHSIAEQRTITDGLDEQLGWLYVGRNLIAAHEPSNWIDPLNNVARKRELEKRHKSLRKQNECAGAKPEFAIIISKISANAAPFDRL